MMPARPGRVRTALFVDFDTVFRSLEAVDPRAAKRFAEQPGRWMHWLERGYHTTGGSREGRTRRALLMRKCYLNPAAFSRYRGFFTRSAFSVIDYPPVNGAGRSGSDICMALDIVEALNHATPFDEFVILSAEVDYTPVLQRLRAHDRRTAIFANTAAAPALAAACSYTIDQTVFIESALADASGAGLPMQDHRPEAPRPAPPRSLMPRPAPTGDYSVLPEVASVLHESIAQDGPIPAAELPHFFFRFANFRNSDWFGFRSLRRLAEALTTVDPMLECGDPGEEWQMSLRETPPETEAPSDATGFGVQPEPASGGGGLSALIQTIHNLIGVPALDPDVFDFLFEHMARLFDEGVTDRAAMSKLLQESAGEEGVALPEDAAEFVTAGLWQSGFDAGSDTSDPDVMARAFRDYVVIRCEQAGHPLAEEELARVDEWLVGT